MTKCTFASKTIGSYSTMNNDTALKGPYNYLAKNYRSKTALICRICGDRARSHNFDVVTCMSCKAFFRRNAIRSRRSFRCTHNNSCHINVQTRTRCAACRLRKCFIFGMRSDMIRTVKGSPKRSTNDMTNCNHRQTQLSFPQPMGHPRKNRSMMTGEQWNLLSNIIHAYDDQNIFSSVRSALHEQSALPVKLRRKPSTAIAFISLSIRCVQMLLKQSEPFQKLSLAILRGLIERNLLLVSCLNALFISRKIDLCDNLDVMMSFDNLIGLEIFTEWASISQRLEPNDMLFKTTLFIMLLSTGHPMIRFSEESTENTDLDFTMTVTRIQEVYATVLWKYLIYQHGHTEAVLRYSSSIKTVLDTRKVLEKIVRLKAFSPIFANFS